MLAVEDDAKNVAKRNGTQNRIPVCSTPDPNNSKLNPFIRSLFITFIMASCIEQTGLGGSHTVQSCDRIQQGHRGADAIETHLKCFLTSFCFRFLSIIPSSAAAGKLFSATKSVLTTNRLSSSDFESTFFLVMRANLNKEQVLRAQVTAVRLIPYSDRERGEEVETHNA